MEAFVVVFLVLCIGLIVWLASRTRQLGEQVNMIVTQLDFTNQRLTVMESNETRDNSAHVDPVGAAVMERRQARTPVRQIVSDVQAVVTPILEDVAPGADTAALMAQDLARVPISTGPGRFRTWVASARTSGEWEALIGGNWLNRIGALALMLGIGFFLKYAFDNNWVTQSAQVGIGLALGVALLAFARRTHGQGYAVFAQGLVGAGLAILYLSIYASYNFYDLVPLPAAFVALAVIIAFAFFQALFYDSPAVALLAWGGGFLTPFLLSSSSGSRIGVIAYVLLLDVGILGIVHRRDAWTALEGLSLVATYAVYLTWFVTAFRESQTVLAAVALTLFWFVFYALDVRRMASGSSGLRPARERVASANTVAYYVLMFVLVFPSHRAVMGMIGLAVGAVYFGTILAVKRVLRAGDRAAARFTLTSVVLLMISSALLTSELATVMLWSLEGVALLWVGVRWHLRYVWQPALVFYGLAAVYLPAAQHALAYEPIQRFVPVLNFRFLGFLTLAAALAAGAALVRRLSDSHVERIWTSLNYGWSGVIFVLVTVETDDIFRRAMDGATGDALTTVSYARLLAVAGVWTILALPFVWFGLKRRVRALLTFGLGCCVLGIGLGAAVGASFQPLHLFVPVLNIRAALLAITIAALFCHVRWMGQRRELDPWMGIVRVVLQGALVLLGFELLTAEINDYFAHRAEPQTQSTQDVGIFIEMVALSIVWMTYSLFLVWNGVRATSRTLLVAGLGCAGVAIGAGVYGGFIPQPGARLPLVLGTRAVMMPLLMVGLFLHMRWMKDASRLYRWLDTVLVAFQAAMVLLGFELLTGETRDFFDHLVSGPFQTLPDSTHLRNLEQLTLSALWLCYAMVLMGIGLSRRTRWMRVGSIALFAFIILKIFGYDLSFLQGLYRSVSFAGLGLILLVVSYLYSRYHALLLEV